MTSAESETKSVQEIAASFQDWLKINYLSDRIAVSNGQILFYGKGNFGLPFKIISIIIFLVIPMVLTFRLLFLSSAGFDEKFLLTPIAVLYLLLTMAVMAKGGQTILTINLNKGTIKTEKTGAILKRFNISTEINLKEITKVELWEDPPGYYSSSFLLLSVWVKSRRVELLYFPKVGPYGDTEPYIATQVKNLVDAAIRQNSANIAPSLNI